MTNELHFTKNTIRLVLPRASDWSTAKRLTGEWASPSPGVFEYRLSTQNLQRVGQYFQGASRPEVKSGWAILSQLRDELRLYKERKEKLAALKERKAFPVPPNGKLTPYQHQTLLIGALTINPYTPGFSDCGTGKTGASLRTMELVIAQEPEYRGSILVSAPLSVIETGWIADAKKFTDLRPCSLWIPDGTTTKLGASVVLKDFGEKLSCIVAVKTQTKTVYFNHETGELRMEKPTTLSGMAAAFKKYQGSWKVGFTLEGEQIPFGALSGREISIDQRREDKIRTILEKKDADFYLINHDGVRIYEKMLSEYKFRWTLVDESTKIKNSESSITDAHIHISEHSSRRTILSGTPDPNGHEDLWSQFYFLDRGLTLEPSKRDFLTEYFQPVKVGFRSGMPIVKQVIRKDKLPKLLERVQSVGILLNQRDCIDLPPRTDIDRVSYMTEEQENAYEEMAQSLVATLRDSFSGKSVHSTAANVLAQICRLRQITSGFLSNREGELVALKNNPKYETIDSLLDELGGKKLLIICQFKEEIRALLERYKDRGARAIYGDVSKAERDEAIVEFQEDPSRQTLIIHPAAAAHGITLVQAAHALHESFSNNYEHYYQTIKRIERIGQVNPMFVYRNIARFRNGTPTIDEDLLDDLKRKNALRDQLYQENEADLAKNLYSKLEERFG